MAEYIDKKPFLDKLLYMGYFDDNDEIKEVADSFTVADVIERSKIDKAIKEIEDLEPITERVGLQVKQEILNILKGI